MPHRSLAWLREFFVRRVCCPFAEWRHFLVVGQCEFKPSWGSIQTPMRVAFILPVLFLVGCSKSEPAKPGQVSSELRVVKSEPLPLAPTPAGAFKLFPTKNIWTQLKLDTRDGRIWQVSISTQGPPSESAISLVSQTDHPFVGRFALEPTQNIWNFILLDTSDGRTWQVQWGTNTFVYPTQ